MTESKRWIVTYTKHIHQKRKVYQDGVLAVIGSRNKAMLYDDSEKLLGSRFLKKDEIVESGTTLTLQSHLVDIGELEGNIKLSTDMNTSLREDKLNERNIVKGRNIFQAPSRAAKSTCLHNVSTVVNKLEATNDGRREWDALYTTQLTQKAKKYHDGTLQLAGCGSHANQVILLDEDGTILASKFLKSVDRIENGITYQMPGYLVQVCEQRNIQREDSKMKVSVDREVVPRGSSVTKIPSSANVLKESKKNASVDRKAVPRSSSVTKIQKISKTNNLSNEVMASNTSKDKMSPTFGKPTTNTIRLNYHQECRNKNTVEELDNIISSSNPSNVVITGEFHTKKPYPDEVSKRKSNLEDPRSNSSRSLASNVNGTKEVRPNKPLRDATQILNSLKKIVPEEIAGHKESKLEKAQPSKFPVSNPEEKDCNGEVILEPSNGEYSRISAEVSLGKDHQGLLTDNAIEDAYPEDARDDSNTSDISRSMTTSALELEYNLFSGADSNHQLSAVGIKILDALVLSKNKELSATVSDSFVQRESSCDPTYVQEDDSKHKPNPLIGEVKENYHHELSKLAKASISADDKEVGAVGTSVSEFVKDELPKQVNVEIETSDEKGSSGTSPTTARLIKSPSHAVDVLEETSQENSSISNKRIKVCNFPSFDLGI